MGDEAFLVVLGVFATCLRGLDVVRGLFNDTVQLFKVPFDPSGLLVRLLLRLMCSFPQLFNGVHINLDRLIPCIVLVTYKPCTMSGRAGGGFFVVRNRPSHLPLVQSEY